MNRPIDFVGDLKRGSFTDAASVPARFWAFSIWRFSFSLVIVKDIASIALTWSRVKPTREASALVWDSRIPK